MMTKLYVTYCSRGKTTAPGFVPAIDRYMSDRILLIHKKAKRDKVDFAILSGSFGLLKPSDEIPWYNHLMLADDIQYIKERIQHFILDNKVRYVKYFTVDPNLDGSLIPYLKAMRLAVSDLDKVSMDTVFVS